MNPDVKTIREEYSKNAGFTLVEILAVLVTLGILAAIAVPTVLWIIENSRDDVCEINRVELERLYKGHLQFEDIEHTTSQFQEFLIGNHNGQLCPSGGVIHYDGEVKCSIHSESNDDPGEENAVPFL